jgi:recombination protein RecT
MADTTAKGNDETMLQQNEEGQPTISEKFSKMVIRQFGSNTAGAIQVSDYQKRLVQGYFICIDRALQLAEENRARKNRDNKDHKYDNMLPITWQNVNLKDMALDLVHYAKMGLDMMQENHLSPIPYKNNKTQKYDITLMQGYAGIQYIAEKYAIERPLDVTVELVHKADTFKPLKKSRERTIESYDFDISNPFDRGEVIGGFGYIQYEKPEKNKLIIMTIKDILKRKPRYAAPEFWGGKIKVWENGKQVEKESDGWYEEMCLKTLKREVYSSKNIPRDPQKIDENYQYMKYREAHYADIEAQAEIESNANTIDIEMVAEEPKDQTQQAVEQPVQEEEKKSTEKQQAPASKQMDFADCQIGPNF